MDVDAVTQAYIDCALWSSSIEANDLDMPDDTSMESAGYTADDLHPSALASMRADVEDFLTTDEDTSDMDKHRDALEFWAAELGDEQIGHDFWLTRNRHGAGFWDRFMAGSSALGSIGAGYGRILTDDAKPYGTSDLYIGDDGLIYVS